MKMKDNIIYVDFTLKTRKKFSFKTLIKFIKRKLLSIFRRNKNNNKTVTNFKKNLL